MVQCGNAIHQSVMLLIVGEGINENINRLMLITDGSVRNIVFLRARIMLKKFGLGHIHKQ